MIKEKATVVKVGNGQVTLTIVRKNECAKCGLCGMKKDENSYNFTVKTDEVFKVGQIVTVTFLKERKLTAIFFALVLPLIALFSGVFIGYVIGSEAVMLILGILFSATTYFMLKYVDKWFSKKEGVTPIIEKTEE